MGNYTKGPGMVNTETGHQMVTANPPTGHEFTPQHPKYIVVQTGMYVNTPKEEQRANADLIAAAPELLEACKEAVFAEVEPDWGMIYAAIAKAEGKKP
jgi:hypothetical protein